MYSRLPEPERARSEDFCILRGCQSSRAKPLHQESICVHLEHWVASVLLAKPHHYHKWAGRERDQKRVLFPAYSGQMEAWQRMTDQNPEMRFTLHSSPLSGWNTTLGLWIPHHSGWPRKHRRLR